MFDITKEIYSNWYDPWNTFKITGGLPKISEQSGYFVISSLSVQDTKWQQKGQDRLMIKFLTFSDFFRHSLWLLKSTAFLGLNFSKGRKADALKYLNPDT